ncbi:hypothetical protein ACOALZ_11490 [Nocardiopsis algeriensis]|uniref:hypothetical protein n=1 Tax=Nocardiopsis algeriensis TaxID=1478215 RepID=UPI003B4300F9
MARGAVPTANDEVPVGQELQEVDYQELVDPRWSGPVGLRRPILLVHGPQGFGKSHFLLFKAHELERIRIPYAYLDLADTRYRTSAEDVFTAISSHRERGLARVRDFYPGMRFPLLWIALMTARLELEGGPSEEDGTDKARAEISQLVDSVWPGGSQGWFGRAGGFLGRLGEALPPPEMAEAAALPIETAKWVASVSQIGGSGLDRAFEWIRGRGQGAQGREQATDSLYHLWLQAQEPDEVDPVTGVSNREKTIRFLCEALYADIQNLPKQVGRQPTPVLLLDNADQGIGPLVLRCLAAVPAPSPGRALPGSNRFPEPLTVVAATGETVEGLDLDTHFRDTRQYMRFSGLTRLQRRHVSELFSRSAGGDRVSGEVVELLADFTGGHPGTTAQLVEAWVAVKGSSLHGALTHRLADPASGLESAVTVEERMLATALGADPGDLDTGLREALTTCAAARDFDAGLWLHRSSDLIGEVDRDRLLAHPLWDGEDPERITVLRRLLLRRLARRPESDPAHWNAVHQALADHYRDGGAGVPDAVEREAYHRLCAGQLGWVARHLEDWLATSDIDGQEWVRRLRSVTAAPMRTRPALPLVDSWSAAWQAEAEAGTDTETVLKLVAARQILGDPDFFRTRDLHARCHSALSELAERIPVGAVHVFDEAAWHLRQANKFDN